MKQFWLALPALAVAATGLDLAGVDRSVAPGDDFFRYANGAWLKATEIPADRASYGPGAIVEERTTEQIAAIVRAAASAGAPAGTATQRVGDYYASLVDQAAIDGRITDPLVEQALTKVLDAGRRHGIPVGYPTAGGARDMLAKLDRPVPRP